jgi:hypothetical protein
MTIRVPASAAAHTRRADALSAGFWSDFLCRAARQEHGWRAYGGGKWPTILSEPGPVLTKLSTAFTGALSCLSAKKLIRLTFRQVIAAAHIAGRVSLTMQRRGPPHTARVLCVRRAQHLHFSANATFLSSLRRGPTKTSPLVTPQESSNNLSREPRTKRRCMSGESLCARHQLLSAPSLGNNRRAVWCLPFNRCAQFGWKIFRRALLGRALVSLA